ncbi:MAG TPA: sialidase family protein [Vicinamibacterales bacterium]|nr:sialidase family protein [Vicinamibacterales bacterium]
MKTLTCLLIVALTSGLASASSETSLAVTGRTNSTPWVAASGSFVAVAWGAAANGKGDVFLAVSRDSGRTFSRPVRVNSVVGDARISGEIAPRVALMARSGVPDPLITVTWNAKDGTTQIRTARSRDGGRTFVDEMNLQTKGAIGDRGWQASTLDARGALHTIWLDHRAMAAGNTAGDHSEHKGESDGVAMAQKSGLYYAADGQPERELFKGVCYCCKTAIAAGPKGAIYAAWRHVFAGNMRDMGFTMSRDGGKTFAPLMRVNQDGWSIQGCPDDGPAMAVDAKGTVHLVWPTVKDEQGVILYATSQNGGAFSTPVRVRTLGGPKPSHPQIVIDNAGRVFVGWDEVRDGVRRAAIAPLNGSGAPEILGDTTSYPVMAATEAGVVAVWTSGAPDRSVIGFRAIQ